MRVWLICIVLFFSSMLPAPSAIGHDLTLIDPEASILGCVSCINRCQMYQNPENTSACVSGCIIACVLTF